MMTGRFPTCVRLAILFFLTSLLTAQGQTFLDRQNEDDFRIVSYNMFWDELFEDSSGRDELGRMVNAIDADVLKLSRGCANECCRCGVLV